MWGLLGIVLLLGGGCTGPFGGTTTQTMLRLHHTILGTTPPTPLEGCLWIVGPLGPAHGMVLVLAQGTTPLETCLAARPSPAMRAPERSPGG
jgi:hypothetical protein